VRPAAISKRASVACRTAFAGALLLIALPALPAERGLKHEAGEPAPELRLKDLAGREHTWADHRGKVVLVNFWATWCEPCRDELPSLVRLKKKLKGQPFEVLAIDLGEGEERVKAFLAKLPLTFPVLLDPDSTAMRDWKLRGLPTSFVVDGDGRVRYSYVGEFDWAKPAVVRRIESILPSRR
jgi:thiol-disulfide isomerase/thioredoxin